MPEKSTFTDACRKQESFLAPLEKRCLIWLANRLGPWVTPDHLTLLGFIAMLGVGVSYALVSRWRSGLIIASICLAVNWFGDSLDGTLARVRNKLRPRYGFYVDHICDAFGTAFLLGGLAWSGLMTPLVALGALSAYFLLNIEVYLATYTLGSFQMSFWKFSPTELRLLLIIANTVLIFRPASTRLFGPELLVFDVGAAVGIVAMVLMTVITAVRHTRVLYREETH